MSNQILFEMKKNLIAMMKDRGYNVSKEEGMMDWNLSEFVHYYEEQLNNTRSGGNKFYKQLYDGAPKTIRGMLSSVYKRGEENLAVLFVEPDENGKKIGIKPIESMMSALEANSLTSALFVFPGPTTPVVKDRLSGFKTRKYQIFRDFRLFFKPTENVLVPGGSGAPGTGYHKLNDDEKANFLSNTKVTVKQLQTMLVTGAISKWYDYQIGDIIYIVNDAVPLNKEMLPPKIPYYRVVVDGPEEDF